MEFEKVEEAMDGACGRVFPGAVLLVRQGERIFYQHAFGNRSLEPERTPMQENTIFDLSSLTKPLATTIALMLLVRDGKVRFDDRITRFFPGFGVHGKTHITIRQLLTHSSGLRAWRAFYKEILQVEMSGGKVNYVGSRAARDYVYEEIQRERLEGTAGTRAVYSDLGFMLLGALIECLTGTTLDRFCHDRIYAPLGLRTLTFFDSSRTTGRRNDAPRDQIAPTENCLWRNRILCGEVHDDNAYSMGGVAGHAGLFGSARDVDTLLCRLKRCYEGHDDFVPSAVVRELWTQDTQVPGSTWALGWDTPSPKKSSAGTLFSPHTIGHLGFTGTSFWMDLERNCHVILLSNRVHPRRDNEEIRDFRPVLHDLVSQALAAETVA